MTKRDKNSTTKDRFVVNASKMEVNDPCETNRLSQRENNRYEDSSASKMEDHVQRETNRYEDSSASKIEDHVQRETTRSGPISTSKMEDHVQRETNRYEDSSASKIEDHIQRETTRTDPSPPTNSPDILSLPDHLARECSAIITDPLKNIKKVSEILKIQNGRGLVFLALTKVFKNIVPLYKIRPVGNKVKHRNREVSVSDYDGLLLRQYNAFVRELCLSEEIESFRSAGELLKSLDHFNFTDRLISKLLVGTRRAGIDGFCINSIVEKVKEDPLGDTIFMVLDKCLDYKFSHLVVKALLQSKYLKKCLEIRKEKEAFYEKEKVEARGRLKEKTGKGFFKKKFLKDKKGKKEEKRRLQQMNQSRKQEEAESHPGDEKNYKRTVNGLQRLYFTVLKTGNVQCYESTFLGIRNYIGIIRKEFHEGLYSLMVDAIRQVTRSLEFDGCHNELSSIGGWSDRSMELKLQRCEAARSSPTAVGSDRSMELKLQRGEAARSSPTAVGSDRSMELKLQRGEAARPSPTAVGSDTSMELKLQRGESDPVGSPASTCLHGMLTIHQIYKDCGYDFKRILDSLFFLIAPFNFGLTADLQELLGRVVRLYFIETVQPKNRVFSFIQRLVLGRCLRYVPGYGGLIKSLEVKYNFDIFDHDFKERKVNNLEEEDVDKVTIKPLYEYYLFKQIQ